MTNFLTLDIYINIYYNSLFQKEEVRGVKTELLMGIFSIGAVILAPVALITSTSWSARALSLSAFAIGLAAYIVSFMK